ncbi:hypothetical protein CPB86DRAFT_720063 [Serendipita vermifera]|nr:hypothetical protein CPB86DRAFT_720063 [Serendipita vermifera]
MAFVREFDLRPIPNSGCCWHKADVNCVQISADGTLIASAGDDGRILVSDTASGDILYRLKHREIKINCIFWLQSSFHPQLVGGCSNGSIIIWELYPKGRYKAEVRQDFGLEVEMLEYDFTSDKMLVGFHDAVAFCKLQSNEGVCIGEDRIFNFDTEVGGIGILASGNRCVATLSREKSIAFLTSQTNTLTLDTKISVDYIPFVFMLVSLSFLTCIL